MLTLYQEAIFGHIFSALPLSFHKPRIQIRAGANKLQDGQLPPQTLWLILYECLIEQGEPVIPFHLAEDWMLYPYLTSCFTSLATKNIPAMCCDSPLLAKTRGGSCIPPSI